MFSFILKGEKPTNKLTVRSALHNFKKSQIAE